MACLVSRLRSVLDPDLKQSRRIYLYGRALSANLLSMPPSVAVGIIHPPDPGPRQPLKNPALSRPSHPSKYKGTVLVKQADKGDQYHKNQDHHETGEASCRRVGICLGSASGKHLNI